MADENLDDAIEAQLPALAAKAFEKARKEAFAAGLSVLYSDGDAIYEYFPDGTRKFVKNIEPPTKVALGARFVLLR